MRLLALGLLLIGLPCFAQTYPVPASLYFQNYNTSDVLPSHWYLAPTTAGPVGVSGTAYSGGQANALNVYENGWMKSNDATGGGDGALGAGSAGIAAGADMSDAASTALFTAAGMQVACALAEVGEVDGCGYQRFVFSVTFKDPSMTTNYYQVSYMVTHGRNGYVSWANLSVGIPEVFVFGLSGDCVNWTLGHQPTAGPFVPKFPGKAALDALLNNPNGLLIYSAAGVWNGGVALGAKGTVATLAGSDADTRLRAQLVKLRSSLTTKQDMTSLIPRCSGQDIEASGAGGSTDHVGDADAVTPAIVDADHDGVPDFKDAEPDSGAHGLFSGYNESLVWSSFDEHVPRWTFVDLAPESLLINQFPSVVLEFRKPQLGGDVAWFSQSLDFNPLSNPALSSGSALDAYRQLCRALGVCFVVFWTVHGFLITFRQW